MKHNDDYGQAHGYGSTATEKAEEKTEEIKTADAERVDEGNETNDKTLAAGNTEAVAVAIDDNAPVTGFIAFRAWANRSIRRLPAGVWLNYAAYRQNVTEITHDGQIR